MIDDYAYEGMEFIDDLDLILPPGTKWGPQGKNYFSEKLNYF